MSEITTHHKKRGVTCERCSLPWPSLFTVDGEELCGYHYGKERGYVAE